MKDIEIFDILKEFEDNLKNCSKKAKKKLSIIPEFKEMIQESLELEEREASSLEYAKDLEESYQLYAKRTKDRRRGRGRKFKKAILTSIGGAITSNVESNVVVNGENFQPELGELHVLFEGGGQSASSSTTSNAAGTQATVQVPQVINNLNGGISVALFVLPGNLSGLQSEENVTTTIQFPIGGGG